MSEVSELATERLRDQLQRKKQDNRFTRILEKVAPNKAWLGYGAGFEAYKYQFWELLHPIPDNSIIVDLMGTGEFYRDIQKEGRSVSGVALTLADTRDRQSRIIDKKFHNSYVTGDLLNRKTWKKLQQQLPNGKADLIVCNPGGGWVSFPKSPRIFIGFLDRVYRLLNVDGRLITTVPEEFIPQIENLRDKLTDNKVNCEVKILPTVGWEYSDNPSAELMLQRENNSPATLSSFITPEF